MVVVVIVVVLVVVLTSHLALLKKTGVPTKLGTAFIRLTITCGTVGRGFEPERTERYSWKLSMLERPAADADLEEVGAADTVTFEVSGPAELWTRKVLDTFPSIDTTLAECLGEARYEG